MKHVEPLHVDDGRVDAELSHLQSLAHVLDEVRSLLAVALLLVRGDGGPPRGGGGQLFLGKIPSFAATSRHSKLRTKPEVKIGVLACN